MMARDSDSGQETPKAKTLGSVPLLDMLRLLGYQVKAALRSPDTLAARAAHAPQQEPRRGLAQAGEAHDHAAAAELRLVPWLRRRRRGADRGHRLHPHAHLRPQWVILQQLHPLEA